MNNRGNARVLPWKAISGIAFLLSASVANATILTFDQTSESSNNPATGASALVELTFSDAMGEVRIDFAIHNTTGVIPSFGAGATTSKLTGIALDLPVPISAVSSFSVGTKLDTLLTNVSFPPFGTFDIAFADNNNFLGGNANNALQQGDRDAASVVVSTGLTGLDAAGLEDALNEGFSNGSLNFGARFQQVNAGAGSDKLLGGTCCGDGPTPVPEPSTLGLLGIGLAGIGFAGRRRKRLSA